MTAGCNRLDSKPDSKGADGGLTQRGGRQRRRLTALRLMAAEEQGDCSRGATAGCSRGARLKATAGCRQHYGRRARRRA